MATEEQLTRRFNRYVDKRRRLAEEHLASGHPRVRRDCPVCEGHDPAVVREHLDTPPRASN